MLPEDADGGELARDGRVMEMLSEHTLLGWLEGYLLTGRHGLFHTYEAFAHVIDSMFNQHAKWLDISKNHVPWRVPGRVREHPAVVDGLAAGPQRLLASGPGIHRPGDQQGRRRSRASTCRRTPTRCCRSPTIAFAAPTTSTSSSPTSRSTCSSRRSTKRSRTAPRASASGRGPAPMRARNRMSSWPAAATSPPWRRWRRRRSCASGCRT